MAHIICHLNDNQFLFKENKERGGGCKKQYQYGVSGKTELEKKTNGIKALSRVSMYGEQTNN